MVHQLPPFLDPEFPLKLTSSNWTMAMETGPFMDIIYRYVCQFWWIFHDFPLHKLRNHQAPDLLLQDDCSDVRASHFAEGELWRLEINGKIIEDHLEKPTRYGWKLNLWHGTGVSQTLDFGRCPRWKWPISVKKHEDVYFWILAANTSISNPLLLVYCSDLLASVVEVVL